MIPWRRKWQPTPVFLPGEFHGQRSLAGCSPWGRKESDMTERLMLSILNVNSLSKFKCLLLMIMIFIIFYCLKLHIQE